MTSSIKPPGPGAGPVDGIDASEALADADAATASSTQAAGGAQANSANSATEVWLARLDAGEITPEQAIDGIVEEALQVQGGSRLDPALRAELEDLLRTAMADDPVLGALMRPR